MAPIEPSSDNWPVKRGKLEFARSYLADLHDVADDFARENPNTPGAYSVARGISDALDGLDRALAARGTDG